MPKPPIELNRVDQTYSATRLHFADLFRRYSSPILVADLVKQSEKRAREVRVGNEYRAAVDFINSSIDDKNKIRYCALDYSHITRYPNADVSEDLYNVLYDVSSWAVNQTGFFCSDPKWKIEQGGVIRPFTDEDTYRLGSISEASGVPLFPMEQHGVLRTNCIEYVVIFNSLHAKPASTVALTELMWPNSVSELTSWPINWSLWVFGHRESLVRPPRSLTF